MFTAKTCVSSQLGLRPSERTLAVRNSDLSAPEDLFLALMILRAERNRDPSAVVSAADKLYMWLSGGVHDDWYRDFVMGEIAHLKACVGKMLGQRNESRRCLSIARKHFSRVPANRPLRAKVAALWVIDAYERHRQHSFDRRCATLMRAFSKWGMLNEVLCCELAVAFTAKVKGQNARAQVLLEQLVKQYRHSSFQSAISVAFCNLSELSWMSGAWAKAEAEIGEAFEAGLFSGNPFVVSTLYRVLGGMRLAQGRAAESVEAFRKDLEGWSSSETGTGTWSAYSEILLAEALIESGEVGAARNCLLHALPTLQAENMTEEIVHALKLLRDTEEMRRLGVPSRANRRSV